MKKMIALFSCVLALTMLSGCEDNTKLKYDTIENVRNEVEQTLSKSYNNITIADNINIYIPDKLYTYDPQGIVFVEDENDPNIYNSIKLLYDPDDFDKQKNPNDKIDIAPLNQGTDNPSYQFFNFTKDENAAVDRHGYIHLGPNELLSCEVVECDYVDRIKDTETYQKVLEAADPIIEKTVKLQNSFDMKPYLYYKVRSELGNTFYMIYYCKVIDSVYNIPFGTDNISNIDMTDQGALQQRWYKEKLTVWVDDSFNACGLHIDGLWSTKNKEKVTKIPTLDSTLTYISKEIAPNYTVEITNIQLMYARDNVDGKLCPVWYIELKNGSIDIEDHNRFIINATTGKICSYIDRSYAEHQG